MEKGAIFSEQHRKNLSISHKGQVAWNKGLFSKKEGKCEKCGGSFNKRRKSVRFCSFSCAKKGNKYNLGKRWAKATNTHERNDARYKIWRKSVRDRDGWKCKMANGDCIGKVVAHHILPWRDYPELRYEVNNGITLCHFHHPRKRDDEMKLSPYFQNLLVSTDHAD